MRSSKMKAYRFSTKAISLFLLAYSMGKSTRKGLTRTSAMKKNLKLFSLLDRTYFQ